jgi:hypothetical protein
MNKQIHHITVAYLAFIMLLRMMAMPISLIDYSLNRRFISENLCENRFRTGIPCAGKCYLNKQLAKTNDNQPSSGHKESLKIQLIDFCETPGKPSYGISGALISQIPSFQGRPLISRSPDNIFHPPII